jgi:hypothetical protein
LPPRPSFQLFSLAAFNNLHEGLDFQTRPSYQCAVYILHGHEFGYVFGLYTTVIPVIKLLAGDRASVLFFPADTVWNIIS